MLDFRNNYEKFIDEHSSQISQIKEDLKRINVNRIQDEDYDLDNLIDSTKMKLISFFNLAHIENIKSNLKDFDNKRREAFKKQAYKSLIDLYAKTYNQLIGDTYLKISKIFEVESNKLKTFMESPLKKSEKFSLKFIPPKLLDKEPTKSEIEDATADYGYFSLTIPKEYNMENTETYDLENALFIKFSIEDSIYMKYKLDERQLFYYADKYGIIVINDKQ